MAPAEWVILIGRAADDAGPFEPHQAVGPFSDLATATAAMLAAGWERTGPGDSPDTWVWEPPFGQGSDAFLVPLVESV